MKTLTDALEGRREMQQLTLDFDKLGIAHARDVHFTIEVAEA